MSIFNKLLIKNYTVKKETPLFVFMEVFQLPHGQVLVLEDRKLFTTKFSVNFIVITNLHILVNFNFILSVSQISRDIRSLIKNVQEFDKFSHKNFKLRKRTKLTFLHLIKI